jgi:putative acetyltransferase
MASEGEVRPETADEHARVRDVVGRAFSDRDSVPDLSPLSVLPKHQRQGVGALLVRTAVEHAEAYGSPLLFLEGDPAYYRGRGFEAAGRLGFRRPSTRIPEEAFQVMRLATYSPDLTGTLVYPDAFWRLDCVGLRD